MSSHEKLNAKIDRRSFLKLMGTTGATAAVVSIGNPLALGERFTVKPPLGPNGMPLSAVKAGDLLASQPKEKLAEIFTTLNKSRKWETKMKDLFVAGKDGLYGSFHLYIGQEGISSGVMASLNKDDYIVSTHRGHGHLIAKGGDLKKMSAEIFMKQDGYNKGFGGSMHITDASLGILGMNGIVGAAWYIAAGAAYGAKLRGTKQVAVGFGGDGAANSPYYFSALRNAYNLKLPMVAVVENNFWQISIPMASNVPGGNASTYTKGLPIPSVTVDGNDVAEVFAATKDAIDRARAGFGPSVIEAMTYRWHDHSGFAGSKEGVDGAFGLPYRSDSDVKTWMTRDPIARFKQFLLDRKLFTEAELTTLETDAQKAVDESVEFARKSPLTKPEDGVLNVYAKGAVEPTQFLNGKPTVWVPNPDLAVNGWNIRIDT